MNEAEMLDAILDAEREAFRRQERRARRRAEPTGSSGDRVRRSTSLLMVLTLLFSLFLVANPSSVGASSGGTCVGASSTFSIQTAKTFYLRACGQQWDGNSGHHTCFWASDGWTCSGPKTPTNNCHGSFLPNIDDAKRTYARVCGQQWDGNSGFHSCRWLDHRGDWVCKGPSSR